MSVVKVESGSRAAEKRSGHDAGQTRRGGAGRVMVIKSAIRERIDRGEYTSGGRLPSERQLCQEFDIARVTLHEILLQLETDGLIYREDRRGWFVSTARFVYNPQSRGHFELTAIEQRRVPSTAVIDTSIVVPPPIVRDLLGLGPTDTLARIRRVRSINDRAVLYVEHYCFPDVFPGLFDHDLSKSMTELYRDVYDFHYGRMKYRIMPTAVSGDAAGYLRVSNGSPAILVTRVNHAIDDSVRDCDLEYWRHDAVLIEVDVELDAIGATPRN